jgi:hypothetical protein
MRAQLGLLRTAREHPDGTQALDSLFALPVKAMEARFVNLPAPANAAHFFGPLERNG